MNSPGAFVNIETAGFDNVRNKDDKQTRLDSTHCIMCFTFET